MVNWWAKQREESIRVTKYRIAHCEKHGMGDTAMKEKASLKKQEKHHKDKLP